VKPAKVAKPERAMRSIRYQTIADELRRRARAAAPGSVLPSEAELSAEFDASRVTIRRALELVRDDGLIDARQGFGWFVATEPVRQRLERLLTIESQLETSGRDAVRRVVDFEFVAPPPHVVAVLGSDRVLRVKRVNLADGEPFAVVTVWCPAEFAQDLSMSDVERRPFYELLDIELRGATQTIAADLAEAGDAELLAVPAGSPLLRCRRVTTDTSGRRVLMSEHLFPAHRTEFVVDLPHDPPSSIPTGLRLVDNP
jgi:GntR family transcriptional regulator